MKYNEKGERLVEHHTHYKEIQGYDKTIWMTVSEHRKLHNKLRRENKCNIPPKELAIISNAAIQRTEKSKKYHREYYKKCYEENKEEIIERNKKYPEKHPDYMKEYYKKNKEECIEKGKDYYKKNRTQVLKNKKLYGEKNKIKIKEYQRKYKARKKKERSKKEGD